MRNEEHQIQVAVVEWCRLAGAQIDGVGDVIAIPNGGHRDVRTAVKLKAEGVRPGVPDLFWPVPRDGFFGLWIELKTATGRVTPHQLEWQCRLTSRGYDVRVCRGVRDAIDAISEYFEIDTRW